MVKNLLILLGLIGFFTLPEVWAGTDTLFIIVNKKNDIKEISEQDLKRIFIKKRKIWAEGSQNEKIIDVVYQPYTRAITEQFSEKVVNLSLANLKKYWIEERYKGGELHPEVLHNTQGVISYIAKNTNAIGYIVSVKDLPDMENVRVIAEVKIQPDVAEKKCRAVLFALQYLDNFKKDLNFHVVGDDDIADSLPSIKDEQFKQFKIKNVTSHEINKLTDKPDVIFIGKNANIPLIIEYAKKNKVLLVTDSTKIFNLGVNLSVEEKDGKISFKWAEKNGFIWNKGMSEAEGKFNE